MAHAHERQRRGTRLNVPQPPGQNAPLRVSAIVIAKNAERHIGEALESIFLSTRRPDEVIVIDGASTDNTRDIALSFSDVRVESQHGTGIAAAYNQGISSTSGELVAFLSADDRWFAEKIARQVAVFELNPLAEIVLCHVEHALESGCQPPPGFRASLLDAPVPGFIMECLMTRRAVFDKVGRFNSAFAVSEDTDWFARARDSNVATIVLPETLVWKRVHDRNSSLNEPQINGLLLRALRASLERKRSAAAES